MKNFAKSLKRQDGFTLVELMVVVAIIGLLSAVAIPNFKKYQAKAKISEAKLQLSAIYTAQTAFFSDYNMYAACLKYMGFDPNPEINNRYYAVGIAEGVAARDVTAHNAAVSSGLNAASCPQAGTLSALPADAWQTYFFAGKGIGGSVVDTLAEITASNATGLVGAQDTPANMTFTAVAVGYISQDALTGLLASGLTIDQTKTISNVTNGY